MTIEMLLRLWYLDLNILDTIILSYPFALFNSFYSGISVSAPTTNTNLVISFYFTLFVNTNIPIPSLPTSSTPVMEKSHLLM